MSDFESPDVQAGDSITPEREGLASGYRMRADAHYVDLLSSAPRQERPRVEATRVRDDHTQLRAARERRVLEQLSGDVAAVEGAAAMTIGVSGAVRSLAGLLTGVEGAVIRVDALVEVDGDEDDLQSIEVCQAAVAVLSSLKQRFFDADWVERPGGWLGAIGAAAAEAVAVQLGGGINLSVGSRRGCTVRFAFA